MAGLGGYASDLIFNVKKLKHAFCGILSIITGADQVSRIGQVFSQTTIIEVFFSVLYDKGDELMVEAFLKGNQPADTAIPILKGMDALESEMEINDLFEGDFFLFMVGRQ